MAKKGELSMNCDFKTERLVVYSLQDPNSLMIDETVLAQKIISILTDEVTQSLPEGWQGIHTNTQAISWIHQRKEEGLVSLVETKSKGELIGFLFLSVEPVNDSEIVNLRLGYLLTSNVWGHGLGSELIEGLIAWCKDNGQISLVSGGVDESNIGSRKVLEKNGFMPSTTQPLPDGVVLYEKKLRNL